MPLFFFVLCIVQNLETVLYLYKFYDTVQLTAPALYKNKDVRDRRFSLHADLALHPPKNSWCPWIQCGMGYTTGSGAESPVPNTFCANWNVKIAFSTSVHDCSHPSKYLYIVLNFINLSNMPWIHSPFFRSNWTNRGIWEIHTLTLLNYVHMIRTNHKMSYPA